MIKLDPLVLLTALAFLVQWGAVRLCVLIPFMRSAASVWTVKP